MFRKVPRRAARSIAYVLTPTMNVWDLDFRRNLPCRSQSAPACARSNAICLSASCPRPTLDRARQSQTNWTSSTHTSKAVPPPEIFHPIPKTLEGSIEGRGSPQ